MESCMKSLSKSKVRNTKPNLINKVKAMDTNKNKVKMTD